MNKSYKDFVQWVQIIISSLISITTAVTIHFLYHYYGDDDNMTHGYFLVIFITLSLIPIIIVSKVLIKLVEVLISKSPKIRAFILGKFFIEGYWLEKTFREKEKKEIISYAIVKFSYHNLNFVVSGDAYNDKAKFVGNFRSTIVDYKSFNLTYAYKGNHNTSQPYDVKGHGQFVFSESKNIPLIFTGFFQDTEEFKNVAYIRGYKIQDKKILKRISEFGFREKLLEHYAEKGSLEGFPLESIKKDMSIKNDEFIFHQRTLLATNNTNEVLENLITFLPNSAIPKNESYLNDVLILSANYKRVSREKLLMTSSTSNEELNKINESIVIVLEEISKLSNSP